MKSVTRQKWMQAAVLALALALLLFSGTALAGCVASSSGDSTTLEETQSQSTLEFRNESSLQSHFKKHGEEVGCSNAQEYVAHANDVISDPASWHKTQHEDGDDVYFRPSTGEIVIVSVYGKIRTYFIADEDYFRSQ